LSGSEIGDDEMTESGNHHQGESCLGFISEEASIRPSRFWAILTEDEKETSDGEALTY